ncbi:MAG TPA: YifB family Mg chelatase-like AAA ATPase [Halanaerobiales bacterium]|nr:YifB family Mg chelatase-like AAA ATPase [Halanaerobiales bacterium]
MLSRVISASIMGIEAITIQVEVDLARGLPAFDIVGLPDAAVRESKERVRAAVKNAGYEFPVQRITINLAPGDIKKYGSHYDLAIAVGILAAGGLIKDEILKKYLIAGELSLTGELRKVKGVLPMTLKAREEGLDGIVVPPENYQEASLVEGIEALPARTLNEAVEYLRYKRQIDAPLSVRVSSNNKKKEKAKSQALDFAEVKGQQEAKRALQIAAAGSHNMLMIGPPGSGKTMLARRLGTILPPLTREEALELTKIYSIMGLIDTGEGLIRKRPFRAPHHSISTAGLIGGGKIPEPGEVSLAHIGTLFLDELPEYHRDVLEMLRQPLEEGEVTIVRSSMSATFPADFMLVTAMNPCPCGYYGDDRHICRCTPRQINRYRSRVSGPLLDRIDIHIEVPALKVEEITGEIKNSAENSATMRERVMAAHERQVERYSEEHFNFNSQLKGKKLKKYCLLDDESVFLMKDAIDRLGLSARAYDRILRLSRTIADMEGSEYIKSHHVAEAIQYRSLDRKVY